MKYLIDDENDANLYINSNSLNTITSRWKDKISQKKKINIKPKGKSSLLMKT